MRTGGVRPLRRGPRRRSGDRRAEAAGVRGPAGAAAEGDRIPGAGEGMPRLRGGDRGRGPGGCGRPRPVRAAGARPCGAGGLRPSPDGGAARAAGHLHYVHVACTEFLTAMHTGGRSAADIDAGEVLPGYTGTIVRDGYARNEHLADALHAWGGAHGLRDLRGVFELDPDGQVWARSMADLLIRANAQATAARAAGQARLSDRQLARVTPGYRRAGGQGVP